MKAVGAAFFALFCLQSAGAAWVIPPETQVLNPISTLTPDSSLPNQLRLLTWNIQKAEQETAWRDDFLKLSSESHLSLLQEGLESNLVLETLRSLQKFSWWMARAFFMETDRLGTGVITGAQQEPFSQVFLRSSGREPFSETPKMALLSTYTLQSGARLLVVNVHALNFTGLGPYERQISEITALVARWDGPVIVGGDFNTWNSGRNEILFQRMASANLQHLVFEKDPRKLVLDHFFVRGCDPFSSQVRNDIGSSDHYPLTAEVLCAP